MQKKHFMCTHTWGSDASRDQVIEQTKQMTDSDFFTLFKTDKAEVLQHWMGKDDFFFCHWYADSEDSIYESLELAQLDHLVVTMPSEMPRYLSSERIKGELMADPFE
ncbi:MAG: hypothetical protein CMM67_02490 [Rhodospirillaceae bacterium]|nr:hypothetical protein [Rhodospirillaceae bacterium]OUT80372.1 MAG: hypothetical protein CBB83_02295 [Rhodospirillaceae bacterium TMED23]|tara:strand:- start:826 stop:1146 length:321 start_codon:yes stop_codon:yes gene_type:complete